MEVKKYGFTINYRVYSNSRELWYPSFVPLIYTWPCAVSFSAHVLGITLCMIITLSSLPV